ncbi:hypothetical protein NJ7G_4281 [Natrinema sp. J7-2]|nr:hypothetical protein NJ7G_4281 [Natrinema sp. J7-2]
MSSNPTLDEQSVRVGPNRAGSTAFVGPFRQRATPPARLK